MSEHRRPLYECPWCGSYIESDIESPMASDGSISFVMGRCSNPECDHRQPEVGWRGSNELLSWGWTLIPAGSAQYAIGYTCDIEHEYPGERLDCQLSPMIAAHPADPPEEVVLYCSACAASQDVELIERLEEVVADYEDKNGI